MKQKSIAALITGFGVVMGVGLAVAAMTGPGLGGRGSDASTVDLALDTPVYAQDIETEVAPATKSDDAPATSVGADDAETKKQLEAESREADDTTKEPTETATSSEAVKDDVPAEAAKDDRPADTETFIEILAPANGTVFAEKTVVFEGRTEPGATVYAGDYLADVGPEGGWRIVLYLAPGTQTVTFKAVDAAGNTARDSIELTLRTERDEPAVRDFSIHQKYVESREPFEKFFGAGTPGTGITARSEYGSAETRIGEHGEWHLGIEFTGLTETTTFPIVVTTTEGHEQRFQFTWVEADHAFSANQQYGSCSESPPYDVFFGTAVPGSVVEIGSAYGNARVEVGDGGRWEVKVVFEGAPVGETFDVIVADSLGNSKGFRFTHTEAEHD